MKSPTDKPGMGADAMHVVPLRSNCVAVLHLPSDLTTKEVERLAAYLHTMVRPQAGSAQGQETHQVARRATLVSRLERRARIKRLEPAEQLALHVKCPECGVKPDLWCLGGRASSEGPRVRQFLHKNRVRTGIKRAQLANQLAQDAEQAALVERTETGQGPFLARGHNGQRT